MKPPAFLKEEKVVWPVVAAVLFSLALPVTAPPGPGRGGDQAVVYLRAVGVGPVKINAPFAGMKVVNLEPLSRRTLERLGFANPVPVGRVPVPYKDVLFEYPPLPALEFLFDAGLASGVPVPPPSRTLPPYLLRILVLPSMALICACVGLALELRKRSLYVPALAAAAGNVSVLALGAEPVFRLYYAHATVCAFLFPAMLYQSRKLAEKLGRSGTFWLIVLSPTVILLATRNWDLMAVVPFLAGLNRIIDGDRRKGLLTAAISVSAKPVTLVPLGILALASSRGTLVRRLSVAGGVTAASVSPYVVIPAVSTQGFEAFLWWLSHWYCELGVWQMLAPEVGVKIAKTMSGTAVLGLTGLVAWRAMKAEPTAENLVASAMASESFFLSLSWIFPPQMMLYILPLRSVVKEVEDGAGPLLTLADALNAAIVVLVAMPQLGFAMGMMRDFLILAVGARVVGYVKG